MQSVDVKQRSVEDTFMAVLLRLSSRMRRRLPGDALDHTLLPVLRVLGEHGPVRHTELAERVQLDASTVSRHVRHLEERGLTRTRHDDRDGRVRLVELLPDGEAVLRSMLASRHRILAEVLADWPEDDRAALRGLLSRLEHDLEAIESPTENTVANPEENDRQHHEETA